VEQPNQKKALLFGATGLVGNHLLNLLLQDSRYNKVVVFLRRSLALKNDKLTEEIIDFKQLAGYAHLITGDDLFCCLGTTISKASSKAAFVEVDHDMPVQLAKIASENNVSGFYVVSSLGANANSNNFYMRTKGEMEHSVQEFQINKLRIFQPSLLMGNRKDFRLGESIGKAIFPLFNPVLLGPLKKYRAIHGKQVARAMIEVANNNDERIYYPSDMLHSF